MRYFVVLTLLFFGGCQVHKSKDYSLPCVQIPETYTSAEPGSRVVDKWWEEFEEPVLNDLVETSLKNNLDIFQAWNRLCQARAQAVIEGADRFPRLDMNTSVLHTKSSGGRGVATGAMIPGVPETEVASAGSGLTQYALSFELAYEIDIWRRIDSKARAGVYGALATCEELEATALLLTGTVTDTWLIIQEQLALLKLFENQIKINKVLLELVELRFSIGEASALDVYQQRLQLAETESQVPPTQSRLYTSSHQLSVLLGEAPGKLFDEETAILEQELPPFPFLGSPMDLFFQRPDLKAVQRRLRQADYQVAEAVADLFPRVTTLFSYEFSWIKIREAFNQQFYSLAGDILFPIIDGGRRRAEVKKQKCIVCERLNEYGESFFTAMQEVEDALTEERFQHDLIDQLEKQLELAESNLREARLRYMNGLSDYLPVIAAIQSLQDVQRRIISDKRQLHQARAKLYRSLGGKCLVSSCG